MPPELAGGHAVVSHPVGATYLDIATTTGIVIARHRLAGDGTGAVVRDHGHVVALDAAAMAAASSARPHRRKERIPPGPAARAAADTLTGQPTTSNATTNHATTNHATTNHATTNHATTSDATVTDLSAYERAAIGRNTLT